MRFNFITVASVFAVAGSALFCVGLGVGRAEPEPARIAVCDVVGVADALVSTERFAPKLEDERKKAEESLRPLMEEAKAIEDKYRDAKPEDEEAQKAFAKYQELQRQISQARQQIQTHLEEFVAAQYAEAYDLVRASAQETAEKLGYNYVVASRPSEGTIAAKSLAGVRDAVLARAMVMAPEKANITADVKDELKLHD